MKRYFRKLIGLVWVAIYVFFPEGKFEIQHGSDGIRVKPPIWPNTVDFDPAPRLLGYHSSDELVLPELRWEESSGLPNMGWFQPLSEPVRRPAWNVALYLPGHDAAIL